ncbi:MAG TPA: hypothetical protein VJH23_05800 [archaeon]|nr:hypothetical protein [archaeon]
MGILGNLIGKKDDAAKAEPSAPETESEGKYSESCSVCGGGGTDKKWAGKYWHRKCLRSAKKMAKGMF